MPLRAPFASLALLAGLLQFSSGVSPAQVPTRLCNPSVTSPIVVATPAQRLGAGAKAQPPLTDTFDWPDTPLGVIKTAGGYEFFASDGGAHDRQMWQGHWVGNNKSGSFTTTMGTLDNPLGTADPEDVSVSPNPNDAVNPIYQSYGYMGGGPVYQVPAGMTGAGNLLATYHAELPNDALYAALGLAASTDNGLHWTDLGEIIRLNQAYAVGLDGFEIGDGPLVLSPDGKFFYLYFPDWTANGTRHTTDAQGVSTTTNVSVARALAADVLNAAFGPAPQHSIPFQKFYKGNWHLQPALGGASTDLDSARPVFRLSRYPLQQRTAAICDDHLRRYELRLRGIHRRPSWTVPVSLGTFGPIAAYPTAVGSGDDPHTLGKNYYVYFTHLPTDGTGWTNGSLRRVAITCQ